MTAAQLTAPIALHPEAVPGTPAELRWVLPELELPVGRLLRAPGALGELLKSGAIESAWCEPHALRIRLRAGLCWREYGAVVRSAVCAATDELAEWRTDQDADTTLRLVVADVLAGPVGDYLASHGGGLRATAVCDGVVTVAFGGRCVGCTAATVTLHHRVEAAIRERYPALRRVVATPEGAMEPDRKSS